VYFVKTNYHTLPPSETTTNLNYNSRNLIAYNFTVSDTLWILHR